MISQVRQTDDDNEEGEISTEEDTDLNLPDTDTDTEEEYRDRKPINKTFPPTQPVHIQLGYRDAAYGTPLTKAGKVYNKNKAYKEIPQKPSGVLAQTKRELERMGHSPEEMKHILATSVGIAQVVSSLSRDNKNKGKKTYKEIAPPDPNVDLRIDSFDYNISGKTATQILGRRFQSISFPTDASRYATMKGIFNKVVLHPYSSEKARLVAMRQLGQIHPHKENIAGIQALYAQRSREQDDPELIPAPILGDNEADSRVVKTLLTRIGFGPDEKFTVEEVPAGKLKIILSNLRAVITNAGLSESEAYNLLGRITKGVTYETAMLAQYGSETPLNEHLISLQKNQQRMSFSRETEKKLKILLTQDRVENLEKSLSEILIFNDKIHQKEKQPAVRKLLCQRATLKDFRTYIRKHYPSYLSQINMMFVEKARLVAAEKGIPDFPNESV